MLHRIKFLFQRDPSNLHFFQRSNFVLKSDKLKTIIFTKLFQKRFLFLLSASPVKIIYSICQFHSIWKKTDSPAEENINFCTCWPSKVSWSKRTCWRWSNASAAKRARQKKTWGKSCQKSRSKSWSSKKVILPSGIRII